MTIGAGSYRFRQVTSMPAPRVYHQACLLPSGKVLIVGGASHVSGAPPFTLATCLIYDPVADTYTATGSLHNQTIVSNGNTSIGLILLADGRVLCIYSAAGVPKAETYSESTGVWTLLVSAPTIAFKRPRLFESTFHGKVFIHGDDNPTSVSTGGITNLFTPSTNTFVAGPSVPTNYSGASTSGYGVPAMCSVRANTTYHAIVRAGGSNLFGSTASNVIKQAFLYSFTSNAWIATLSPMVNGMNRGAICTFADGENALLHGSFSSTVAAERFGYGVDFFGGFLTQINASEALHDNTMWRLRDDKIVSIGAGSATGTIQDGTNDGLGTWEDTLNTINSTSPYAGGTLGQYAVVQLNDTARSVMFFGGYSTGVDSGAWIFTDDFFTRGVIAGSGAVAGSLQAAWRAQGIIPAIATPVAAGSMEITAAASLPLQSILTAEANVAKASFRLDTVSPEAVFADGGYALDLYGSFTVGEPMTVHIGLTGSTEDPRAYSGIPGQGNVIYAIDATHVRVYTPQLVPGNIYAVTIATVAQISVRSQVLHCHPVEQRLGVLALRQVLPPFWKTGPRNMSQLKKID